MHSQESGQTSQEGSKPDPLAFFPGVRSGGYLFSSGGPPPQPPANFYPGENDFTFWLTFGLSPN